MAGFRSIAVKDGSTTLAPGEDADYTLADATGKDVGDYTVKLTGHGNYTGTATAKFTIAEQKVNGEDIAISFEDADGNVLKDSFTYNGSDQRPAPEEIVVKVGDTTLKNGKDYSLVYPKDGSINVGSYAVTVELMNNYSGTASKGYKIEPKPLTDADVALSADEFIFSGQAQGPVVSVTDGTTTLAEGASYTLADETATKQGTYTLTVSGTGNYTGDVTKTYTIKPYEVGTRDKLVVTFVDENGEPVEGVYTYNGEDQRPSGVKVSLVKEDGTTVELGSNDFTATFPAEGQAVNAGGYNVEVALKVDYSGTTNKGYTIDPKPLTADDIKATIEPTEVTYDGTVLGPDVAIADGTTPLKADESFTVANNKQTEAGTYTATITGTGNYTGTLTQEYTIAKREAQEPLPGKSDPTVADQTDTSITVKPTKPGFEYVVTTSETAPTADDWSTLADAAGYYKENADTENADGHTFTGLEPNTPYYVHVRKAATPNEEASEPKTAPAPTEPTPPSADDVKGAVEVDYDDEVLTAKDEPKPGFEIKDPQTGEWVKEIKPFEPGQEYEVRIAADEEKGIPASEPADTKYKAPDRPDAPGAATVAPKSDTEVTVKESVPGQEYIVLPAKEGGYTEDEVRDAFEQAEKDGKGGVSNGDGKDLTLGKTADGSALTPGTDYVVYTRTAAKTGADPALASHPSDPAPVTTKTATAPLSDKEKDGIEDGTWDNSTANPESVVVNGAEGYEYLVLPAGVNPDELTEADWNNAAKCPADFTKTGEGDNATFTKELTEDSKGNDITPNKDYQIVVRKSETGTSMPSEPVVVPAYTTQEPPADGEGHKDDVTTETITVDEGYEIIAKSPAGTEPTSWKQGKAEIPMTPGATYEIRKIEKTDGEGNVIDHESTPTEFSIPERPPAPSPASDAVDVNYDDETITAKDEPAPGYEIQDPATGEWVKGPVPVEPGKTYPVRVAPDPENGVPASEPVDYTAPSRPDAPDAVSDDDISKTDTTISIQPTDETQEYIVLPPKADGTPYTEDELAKAFEEAEKNGTAKDGAGEGGDPVVFDKDGTGADLKPGTDYQVYNRTKAVPADPTATPAKPGSVASKPAGPTDVTTKTSPADAPSDADAAKQQGSNPTTVTVDGKAGNEYVLVPKGTDPASVDWSKAKTTDPADQDGPITFDSTPDGKPLQPGTEYEVVSRTAETDTAMPSKPRTDKARTAYEKPESPAVTTTPTSVTVSPADAAQEYSIDGGKTWVKPEVGKDGKAKDVVFDGLTPGKDYEVIARMQETNSGLASEPSAPVKASTPKSDASTPAKPKVTAATDDATGASTVTVSPADAAQEYSIDGGETWVKPEVGKDGKAKDVVFDGLTPGKDYEVVARKAATDTSDASEPSAPVKATAPKISQEAPASAPAAVADSSTSVKVNPTNVGEEYIIVPKGASAADIAKAWENAKKSKNGEAITFDGLTSGQAYEVYSRKAGDATHEPSEASPAKEVTPREASAEKPAAVSSPTQIVLPDAVDGQEYVIVPKGTDLADIDWSSARKPATDSTVSFDRDANGNYLVPGAEYTVYTRVPGDATHEPGEPTAINVKTPRGAGADVMDGVSAEGGVAPMTNANGAFLAKDGTTVVKGDDGKYYPADQNGTVADGAQPLTKNADGTLVDASGNAIDFVPAVMVVGTNPDASDNVKGKLDGVPDDHESVNVETPIYDATEHAPTAYDNAVVDSAGIPAALEKGKDYTIQYYAPEDIDPATGLPKEGATPLNTTDPDADNYAFDAGECVAVVTFQGDYAGTISTPVKIEKRNFHVVTPNASKSYDGTPLTAPEPQVWVADGNGNKVKDGLISNQTVEVTVTGSLTAPGSSKNSFQVRFKGESNATNSSELSTEAVVSDEPGVLQVMGVQKAYADATTGLTVNGAEPTAKSKNYNPVSEAGTLTVQAIDLTDNTGLKGSGKRVIAVPIADPSSKDAKTPDAAEGGSSVTYTGKPLTGPVLFDTSVKDENGNPKKLVEGTDYTVAYYELNADGTPNYDKPVTNPTDAGSYAMVVTYQGDYSGEFITTVTIDPAALVVITPSAEKKFDGKALTESKGATLEGFVNGETATLKVTGSQIKVGESDNTYEIVWDGTAKEQNYTVTEELGTLKVTKADEPAKSSSSSSKKTTTTSSSTPKTSDELPWAPFAATAGLSVLAILAAGWRLRRREDGRRAKPRA